ncbi:hypothetical protein F2Q69_00037881 [Brassica cretica]|uniref:RNase H type-1 domain-containing protein n=1 Tax=Brassica cretica TaxID=69181 RepID=A0A8S9SP74_BRACR|nr:hypothetical protein F2Q69_00037881 [Brassica cretica]
MSGASRTPEALISYATWISLPPYGFTSNIFPWICWSLWTSRNRLIFEKRPSTAPEVFLQSLTAIKEWDQAQLQINRPTTSQSIINQPHVHQRPNPHTLFCNTDAAWQSMTGKAGMVWVFTNQEGLEVTHGNLSQDHVSSALMAEALAVRNALLRAIDLNFNSIWLRSDSQVLIAALSPRRHPTELYAMLSDIATISSSSFRFCRFIFIKRDLNGLADSYAKACLHSGPSLCNP